MSAARRDPARLSVGDAIPTLTFRPDEIQLFRFSAVTWNAHRIHYDLPYAQSEGYDGVLVQSHLHGCFLVRSALEWAGAGARLRRFSFQNRGVAVAGDRLTCAGIVTAMSVEENCRIVEIDLEERNQDGVLCAPGHAVVEIPDLTGRPPS